MLRHILLLLFVYGIKYGSSSPVDQTSDSKDILTPEIKKNEVGANGVENNSEEVLKNFRNPVLEYLLHSNRDRNAGPPKKGIIREIRHSQTLVIPNFHPLPSALFNQIPQSQQKNPNGEASRNPEKSPLDNFWEYLKNKTQSNNTHEGCVSSPVLHVHKNTEDSKPDTTTKIQMYPAVGVVVNTYNKDGTLKNSVTHFQPDFSAGKSETSRKEATYLGDVTNANENFKNYQDSHNNFLNENTGDVQHQKLQFRQAGGGGVGGGPSPPSIQWPFANYFPIVINDPFLSVYNAVSSSMYNAVSSMVEYGPEADICNKKTEKSSSEAEDLHHGHPILDRYQRKEVKDSNIVEEVTMTSPTFRNNENSLDKKSGLRRLITSRRKRDTTSVYLKTRQGDKIDITLQEPVTGNDSVSHDERARSLGSALVNPPPLSTILKPPHQESRQFLGYADKKRKTKPSKPAKEEGSSEEVGEEQEEENTNEGQESTNEAVAISPPPEGASVAEAKPIGLAIAGPGGVAASKPQGTAVAGPGGLAIARPVGTAIAGVDVEGSVPIGGQQKQNKKKPKQEQEQTEGELHYVGGLTGPIGNPQPKEFADGVYKSVRETEGNNIQDNLFFRGRHNNNGFQLKLGQHDGKYGFIPMFASPVQGSDRLQKRMDAPTFFHGLLGNNAQGNDQFQNYQNQY